MTNHHVGADALQKLSNAGATTYSATASTPRPAAEELKCPDLELNVLQSIEDVTDRGERGGQAGHEAGRGVRRPPGGHGRDREGVARQDRPAARRRHALPGRAVPPLPLQEVHRRPARVRPGAADRLLRRRPRTTSSTRGSTSTSASSASTRTASRPRSSTTSSGARPGPKEGDLVFVTGHPGTTNRLETLAKLKYRRDVTLPYTLARLRTLEAALRPVRRAAARRTRRQAATDLHRVANARKAFSGQYQGLLDPTILATKAGRGEQAARSSVDDHARVRASTARRTRPPSAGSPTMQDAYATFEQRRTTCSRPGTRSTADLFAHRPAPASGWPTSRPKPNGDRLREYRDSTWSRSSSSCSRPAPIYPDLERAKLADVAHVPGRAARRRAPAGQEGPRRQVARRRGPTNWSAARSWSTSAERKKLVEGGKTAVDASERPDDRAGPADRRRGPRSSASGTRTRSRSRSGRRTRRSPRRGSTLLGTRRRPGRDVHPAAGVRRREGLRGRTARSCRSHTTFGGAFERAEEHGDQRAVRPAEALARRQGQARPGDAVQLRLHGRHHRRQLRQPGAEPRRRAGRHHLRPQPPRRWCATSSTPTSRPGTSRSTRGPSWRPCGSSTTPPGWSSELTGK